MEHTYKFAFDGLSCECVTVFNAWHRTQKVSRPTSTPETEMVHETEPKPSTTHTSNETIGRSLRARV